MTAPTPVRLKVSALTPQAADDVAAATEDTLGAILISELMSNDAGGDGKTFHSIHQSDATVAAMDGATALTAKGAAITYKAASSEIHYDTAGSAAAQALGAGLQLTDTFTYAIRLADGALSTANVTVTVTGVNDTAVIGEPASAAVTEDTGIDASGNLSAAGMLSISDVDAGEASFKTTVEKVADALGELTLQDDGTYAYSVANSAVQHLGAGKTQTDAFNVAALDGTTKQVSFTVTGLNDAAVIGGTDEGSVREDATLTATGALTVSDEDANEASFRAETLAATYGSLAIAADGGWTYTLENGHAAVQALDTASTPLTDTVTVRSVDGTTHEVTIAIAGTDDNTAPSLSGLDGGARYVEGDPAVRVDTDVSVADAELDALNGGAGDYTGATLRVLRDGGANAEDVLDIDAAGASFSVVGNAINDAAGKTFATFASGAGTLDISFAGLDGGVPTSALVDEVASRITYRNTSTTPPGSVALRYDLADGDGLTASGTAAVSLVNVITGTPENDNLVGTANMDRILGLAGHDQILGLEANDEVLAAEGDDYVHVMMEAANIDAVDGGAHTWGDWVRLYGIAAGDVVVDMTTPAGSDWLTSIGGVADPLVQTNFEYLNAFDMAGGALDFTGNGARNNVYGTRLSDTLRGRGGDDYLHGGFGGADRLYGDEGNDHMYLYEAHLGGLVDGGTGWDYATLVASAASETLSLARTSSGAALTTNGTLGAEIAGVEQIQVSTQWDGSAVGDTFTPGDLTGAGIQYVSFSGNGGADVADYRALSGVGSGQAYLGAGNDRFYGHSGHNYFNGGSGDDAAELGGGNDGAAFSVFEGGNDLADGGSEWDYAQFFGRFGQLDTFALSKNAAGQLVVGHAGGQATLANFEAVHLYGWGGGDRVTSGDLSGLGAISVSYQDYSYSAGNDDVDLSGLDSDASAYIYGFGGTDLLKGGKGRDQIGGGEGDDVIRGGRGSDRLYGQQDADTFVFVRDAASGEAQGDYIGDFTVGQDKLRFEGYAAGTELLYTGSGNWALVSGGTTLETFYMHGVTALSGSGTSPDYVFVA
jgi:VCBS repeat-containing protein